MWKNPIPVTHTLKVDKDTIDYASDKLGHIVRQAGLALAIGIPAVIIFGIGARVVADAITANLK